MLISFQGFNTFQDKDQTMLIPNTHMVAPTKPTKQGKHTQLCQIFRYELNNCAPFKRFS